MYSIPGFLEGSNSIYDENGYVGFTLGEDGLETVYDKDGNIAGFGIGDEDSCVYTNNDGTAGGSGSSGVGYLDDTFFKTRNPLNSDESPGFFY